MSVHITHANITTGLAENKFGISMQDMDKVIDRALEMNNVKFVGLHFHIGSQILDMGDFVALCNRINDLQEKLYARQIIVEHINVGGGLGIDYAWVSPPWSTSFDAPAPRVTSGSMPDSDDYKHW